MGIQIGGGGGGATAAPINAEYVVTAADGTLSAEIVVPQLGYYDPDTPPAAAGTYDDEFDNDSIAAAWTLSGGFDAAFDVTASTGPHASESVFHGHLLMQTCDAERAFTPGIGQAFTVVAKVNFAYWLGTNGSVSTLKIEGQNANHLWSMHIGRTTGANQARTIFRNGAGDTQGTIQTYAASGPTYIMLTHDGSKNFCAFVSNDGIGWCAVQIDQALGNFTSFTKVYLTSLHSIVGFEFIRYFTTEGQYKIGKDV